MNPEFIAPFINTPEEELGFLLTVTDEDGMTARDMVNIRIVKYLFFDDFSITNTGGYVEGEDATSQQGKLAYYWPLKKLHVKDGPNGWHSFSHEVPPCQKARFSMVFTTTSFGPQGGRIMARLMEDRNNFYEVAMNSRNGTGGLKKVVNGRIVDETGFAKKYTLNDSYTISLGFSPDMTILVSPDDVALMKTNKNIILVKKFEIYTEGQETFFDRIVLTQDPFVKIIVPPRLGVWDSTLSIRGFAGNIPEGSWVKFVLDEESPRSFVVEDREEPFEAVFRDVSLSTHVVDAYVMDDSGLEILSRDQITYQAKDGYYVAIGDSITVGSGDELRSVDVSTPNDRNFRKGYEPVLESLLESAKGFPHTVINEGRSGDTSAGGSMLIQSILARHPRANYFLILYGMNDSEIPIPSGKGLSPGDPGYRHSYKDNLQRIITAIRAVRKVPLLAKVPIIQGREGSKWKYKKPDAIPRNILIREYNDVIEELIVENGISVPPPDFYTFFKEHRNQIADNVHPDRRGYESMAKLWFHVLFQKNN